MYNIAIGQNPLAEAWLSMLGLEAGAFGRWRDAWLQDDGEHGLRIVVHTRNGGGNRPEYKGVFTSLRKHPEHIGDYDCDFDSTYANIEFRIPSSERALLDQKLKAIKKIGRFDQVVDNRPQKERWETAIERLDNGKTRTNN